MRRRKKKNPLLMRILGISILFHILALPILAHYGAFKKIQEHFIQTTMVNLPPTPPEKKEKAEVKKPQHVAHRTTPTARKAASTTSHPHMAAQRSNLNQPKVVASAGGPGGGDSGPAVDQGTGKAGVLPSDQNVTPPQPTPEIKPQPQPTPEIKPQPTPEIKPQPQPTPEIKPQPVPVIKPEPPKEPVFTAAAAMEGQEPQPTIPDDLRDSALDKTCVADFTVGPDGTPTDVEIVQSTGIQELDQRALVAARQWRFKPATKDGQPIASHVRLHIEFQVS